MQVSAWVPSGLKFPSFYQVICSFAIRANNYPVGIIAGGAEWTTEFPRRRKGKAPQEVELDISCRASTV
jgi:hypothetical protein